MRLQWCSAFLPALICAASLDAQQVTGPPLEIYHGFTLIDGRGGPPIEDAAISVRGNSIVTVGSRRELLAGPNAPRDAIVINLGGGYVIPGLVDAHVHLATSPDRAHAEAELHRMLYSGVTTVRDMAGDGRALASLARDSRGGLIEGPDVYFSALMAGPSFFEADGRPQAAALGETPGDVPWMQAITPETDLVTAVARARGTYATGIKLYANLAEPEITRIAEEAHRQGLEVWAHSMVFPARPLEVIRSGADIVSHVCYLAWEAMAEAPTEYHHTMSPRYDGFTAESQVFTELFDEMLARGTVLDATLAMYARDDGDDGTAVADCDPTFADALVQRAHRAGVPIVAGSDFTTPPSDPFPALYLEMEALVERGGLTPVEAIEAATSVAARAMGVEGSGGVLEHGRPVTFVLLRENPLEDIDNLRSVAAVWKNAERFDRAAYRPRFPVEEEATSAPGGAASPGELLDGWLDMWRRYDLDRLEDLFVTDEALTYFPQDAVGLIQGFQAVRAYHEGLGFVPGGFLPERELWLEDVTVADFDDSVVIGGIWYFGNRADRASAGRGPLTMVAARTDGGYRISHMHFGNYPPEN